MAATRRIYLPTAERGLLVADQFWDMAQRQIQFADDLHLDISDTIATCTSALVMPDWDLRTDRRWPGVNPAMLWHPLLWLDPNLVARRELPLDGTEDTYTEEDESLAVRIALVCMTSGLYDPGEGTWLNTLSTIGLDPTDPRHLERVRRWNEGANDADLDSLSLDAFTDGQEEINELGLIVATAVEDEGILLLSLQGRQALDELLDPGAALSDLDLRASLATIADALTALAPHWLKRALAQFTTAAIDTTRPIRDLAEEMVHTLEVLGEEHTAGADLFEDMFTLP